jgi:hypothetical protein
MFASKTLGQHVVLGVLGFGAIGLSVLLGRSTGTTALAASMGAGNCGIGSAQGLSHLFDNRPHRVGLVENA